MTLIDLIQTIPDWQNKTPEQLHVALSAQSIMVVDNDQYTWAGVASVIGSENAEALRLALESNGMGWAVHQLGGSGLKLSDDLVQGALLALDQAGVPGMLTLANHVKKQVSPLAQANLTATVADVAEALDDLLNPTVPDAQSHEVLLSANRQANGELNVFASVTPVFLRDGKIISRGAPTRLVNGELRDRVLPLIEELLNG